MTHAAAVVTVKQDLPVREPMLLLGDTSIWQILLACDVTWTFSVIHDKSFNLLQPYACECDYKGHAVMGLWVLVLSNLSGHPHLTWLLSVEPWPLERNSLETGTQHVLNPNACTIVQR